MSEKKNEPVKLSGKIDINKDGEGKKFLKTFFSGTLKDAIFNAFTNVFVPYTKDVICKTSTNVVNYWVNGDKAVQTQQVGANRITYWNGVSSQRQVSTPVAPVRTTNNIYNVRTLYFDNRGDAEAILMRLKENLDIYKTASVGDLYELSGVKFSFTDYDYGWRDLSSAYVGRTNDGRYVIELPKAMPLK